jgi:hypothetical protein
MRNWDPNNDRAADLAHGYALHLARIHGDDSLDSSAGRACENCGVTGGYLDQIWTDDGTKPRLCEDCAGEVRRLEKQADELALVPSCEQRQQILDTAETAAALVNRLRAHDMSQCAACAAMRARVAAATENESAKSVCGSGKVA